MHVYDWMQDLFLQSLQSVGLYTDTVNQLLEVLCWSKTICSFIIKSYNILCLWLGAPGSNLFLYLLIGNKMNRIEGAWGSKCFVILRAVLIFQVIRGHYTSSNEVILEDLSLPGLAELKGRWHGSLDASGGGNGDTMVDIFSSLHTIVIDVFVARGQRLNVDYYTDKNTLPSRPLDVGLHKNLCLE